MGGDGFLSDWDGMRRLADELAELGQYFDDDGSGSGRLVDKVESLRFELGPSATAPSIVSAGLNQATAGYPSVLDPSLEAFVETWDRARGELATDLHDLAEHVRWAADEYEETDVRLAFSLPPPPTPAAVPIPGDPAEEGILS